MKSSPQADRRPELKRLISRVKKEQERERATLGRGQEEAAVKRFQLPKKYMHLEEFVKCVQESGIVKDQGTIHRLFDALTVGKHLFLGLMVNLPPSEESVIHNNLYSTLGSVRRFHTFFKCSHMGPT
ncbi:hypothetical protein AMECASPLE_039851 [Ameca splendens]|uniref:Uncharacterized protein n=1 Tax=Ameca splendens TaxID=208324 RepID=A0ABV0XLN3_9TELE